MRKTTYGDEIIATLLSESVFIAKTDDGKFYLYSVEEGPTSDEMDTPEEVRDWYEQVTGGGKWYAVQETTEDAWDRGSFIFSEAVDLADDYGYNIIAVIEGEECTQELHRGADF